MSCLLGVCVEMKRCGKENGQKRGNEGCVDELVCFFCESSLEAGEEVILSKNSNYYHRRCYDFLFTLKRSQIVSSKMLGLT